DLDAVGTDTASEHEVIETSEGCGHRTDVLARRVTEHVDRHCRARVALASVQKPADIGGRSRESKKTSDDVDLVFECVGGMARSGVRTEHVEEGAGVEVAAAGAHDQAAGRG